MKCELEISQLQSAVKTVQKALTARAQLPILTSIKIEVKEKHCILSTTDLFIGIEVKIDAKKTKDGVVIVPGKQFRELITSLGKGEISLTKAGDQLEVKHGKSEASFSLYSLEEYPDFPKVEGDEVSISLSQASWLPWTGVACI